jgi:hypothetical protein
LKNKLLGNEGTTGQIIKSRCSDIQRKMNLPQIKEKKFLYLGWKIKNKWGKEHIYCCSMNGRSGITWFRLGIWKLRRRAHKGI